jgi:hypothetical protein
LATSPSFPSNPELEEIGQSELQKIADLDEYINVLRWYRNRVAVRIARKIEAGAPVERGPRRMMSKGGKHEVR